MSTDLRDATTIDSSSIGDPARFRPLAELERMLTDLPRLNKDQGRVALLMKRVKDGRREVLREAVLAPDAGVPGDAWGRASRPNPEMQIAVMELDVARLIANDQPLTLFGDCLVLDLDLSSGNLPAGSRLRVGGAVLEVTPEPHNGCRKFRARFGDAALRFVSMPALRDRNLRGIYMRVISAGTVKPGDPVEVIARPT
jgi:MOSC domain-containing protein YiiM